jgi:hypothetical protein
MNQTIFTTGWRMVVLLSACFVFTMSVLVSCKKEHQLTGTDLLSPEDLMASGAIDTFGLKTYTVKEDSLRTSNQSSVVIGAVHDPEFGVSAASFYTQFNFEGDIADVAGSIPEVDSVVLSVKYAGYFGQFDDQTFIVNELDEDLDPEANYYKSTDKAVKPVNLMDPLNATQTPNPLNEVVIDDNDTMDPQLRLRLDKNWAETILTEGINTTTFDEEATFKSYFKGLKVSVQDQNPAAGTGGLFYMNLNSNDSKLTFYYKIQGNSTAKSISFIIDSDCADFTHMDVNNSGYDIANVIANHDNGITAFYAQNFNARAVIEFPSVSNLSSNTVVHAALLELPVAYASGNPYFLSTSLNLSTTNDEGKIVVFAFATYDATKKRYVLDLRDYIQHVVAGTTENRPIFVNSSYFSSRPERIIFNGLGTTNKYKPRLIIKYTEF